MATQKMQLVEPDVQDERTEVNQEELNKQVGVIIDEYETALENVMDDEWEVIYQLEDLIKKHGELALKKALDETTDDGQLRVHQVSYDMNDLFSVVVNRIKSTE